jgi:hypothetical protein
MMCVKAVEAITSRNRETMRNRLLGIVIAATLLVLPTGALVRADSPDVETLKKEVDTLRSEIDEVKTLLRERVGVPMPGVSSASGTVPSRERRTLA